MERLAWALKREYGLVVEAVERIDYGIWEESFLVRTNRGRLFAKRFLRKDRKDEHMLRGLHLGEVLRGQGFPVPRVITTQAGHLIAALDGERYQVTEWVEGRTYHPGELPLHCVTPMGALLGRFHRIAGPHSVVASYAHPDRGTAVAQCQRVLERYRPHVEPFARVAQEVLQEQIALLQELPADYAAGLPVPRHSGTCFNSFWVEQVLFRPDGQVAALVDWTDGAGRVGFLVEDLDTGIHLSALGLEEVAAFVTGYQSENPKPESEWRALAAVLCYGHLASTNFLAGWFERPYRRMQDWEETSERWHRLVPVRFRQRAEMEEAILLAVRSAT